MQTLMERYNRKLIVTQKGCENLEKGNVDLMGRHEKSVKDLDRMEQEVEYYMGEMLRINEDLLGFNDNYLRIIES